MYVIAYNMSYSNIKEVEKVESKLIHSIELYINRKIQFTNSLINNKSNKSLIWNLSRLESQGFSNQINLDLRN